MFKRIHWFSWGAVATVICIAAGSVMLSAKRDRRDALRSENERLVREHEALQRRSERLERERKALSEVVERLSIEHRVAEVEVIQQHSDERGRVSQTVLRLTEIDRDGNPLPPHTFGVPGNVPHFDALVIKFKDDYVARGDQLRGRSLALFRRVYGESQAPENGFWFGCRGEVPDVYRISSEPSDFEVSLWEEFWSYATDRVRAELAGVRVAQGEAVYAPMKAGERWLLTLESDGGLNLIKQSQAGHLLDVLAGPPELRNDPTVVASGARYYAEPPLADNESVE